MNLRITPRREPSLPTLYRFGQLKTKKTKKKSVSLIISILVIGLTSYGQVQIGNDINGENPGDLSVHTVAISANGTIVTIGAIENADGGNRSGHVRVYGNVSVTWTQIGEDIAGDVYFDIEESQYQKYLLIMDAINASN